MHVHILLNFLFENTVKTSMSISRNARGLRENPKSLLMFLFVLSPFQAAQSAVMMEKELHQLKRASYASTDQPSWMELARKKSQAWSDMPQIIK